MIRTDAAAVQRIIEACQSGIFSLLSSESLQFEIRRAPPRVQQVYGSVLSLALAVGKADQTRDAAKRLQALGLKEMDALRIAAAYAGRADYLVTCDDHFLHRSLERVMNIPPAGG